MKKTRNNRYFEEETSKKAINMGQILKPKKSLYHLDDILITEE